MKPIPESDAPHNRFLGKWTPVPPSDFTRSHRAQPYFKLHGSTNWVDSGSENVLVLGGLKASIVSRFPILMWIHEEFTKALAQPETQTDDHRIQFWGRPHQCNVACSRRAYSA